MSGYGEAAIISVKYYKDKVVDTPIKAWEKATHEVFKSSWSMDKGCPKSTFLGLCEEGMVLGIPSGKYTKSRKNKAYALTAIEILNENPSLIKDVKGLWKLVVNSDMKHNCQMDVVVSLLSAGLITYKK